MSTERQIAELIRAAVPRQIAGQQVTSASYATHTLPDGREFDCVYVHTPMACKQAETFAAAVAGIAAQLGDPLASAAQLRAEAQDKIEEAERLEKDGGAL